MRILIPKFSTDEETNRRQFSMQSGVSILNPVILQSEQDGRTVELSDGTTIRTNTLVWTAGTSSNPLLESIPCVKERGRQLVTETPEVRDCPGVWILADCSAAVDPRTGKFYPPTAQHARQVHSAQHPFEGDRRQRSVWTIGQLAAIGRRTGVANILGISFSGFSAAGGCGARFNTGSAVFEGPRSILGYPRAHGFAPRSGYGLGMINLEDKSKPEAFDPLLRLPCSRTNGS